MLEKDCRFIGDIAMYCSVMHPWFLWQPLIKTPRVWVRLDNLGLIQWRPTVNLHLTVILVLLPSAAYDQKNQNIHTKNASAGVWLTQLFWHCPSYTVLLCTYVCGTAICILAFLHCGMCCQRLVGQSSRM